MCVNIVNLFIARVVKAVTCLMVSIVVMSCVRVWVGVVTGVGWSVLGLDTFRSSSQQFHFLPVYGKHPGSGQVLHPV